MRRGEVGRRTHTGQTAEILPESVWNGQPSGMLSLADDKRPSISIGCQQTHTHTHKHTVGGVGPVLRTIRH